MTGRICKVCLTLAVLCFGVGKVSAEAERARETAERSEATQRNVKRLLLIGQGPDNHPWSTHEYMAGMRILADCLQPVEGLQTIVVNADEPWSEGLELLDGADGAALFVSQGARWLQQDAARLHAFQKLASRGGGLVALHWGMGCKEAQYIEDFVELFGGCHGGPDRKYKVVDAQVEMGASEHPIMRGIAAFRVRDEFYYALKFARPVKTVTPLLRLRIDGEPYAVAWAWERPDGGRSFGFSGCHFHGNWELEQYRRLVTQAILWSLNKPVPEGLPLAYSQSDLRHPRPKPE